MPKLPPTVDFQLTSKCNNNCKHCFGPNKSRPDMPISEIKKMVSVIVAGGATNIHLSGGEPLVSRNFDQIVEILKQSRLKIFLDTNGDLFFDHKETILKNISVIGLPIDFANQSWRNSKNLKNVLKVLKFLEKQKNRPKIRILTTVTKENMNELEELGNLLRRYKFDVWRIFQFVPLRGTNAEHNRAQLEISKEKFISATQEIERKFGQSFKINIVPVGQRNHAYFFITSDGHVEIATENDKECENKIVGRIFDENIISQWTKYGSTENFSKSAEEILNLVKK